MEEPLGALTSEDLHATYLDRSRKELQRRIEQLKRALAQVCHLTVYTMWHLQLTIIAQENEKLAAVSRKQQGRSNPSSTAIGPKQQLDAVAKAYRDVAASEPLLPFPDSVVPALIALRTTNSTINESKRFLASQKASLQESQDRLDAEKADLADQKALTKALESRIQSLRDGIESRTAMSPGQVARERISELKKQIKETNVDTSKLMTALKKFIDEPLAAMLAAEQVGGPVAGDLMDVDSETLEVGFSATGKRKKPRPEASPDKRQRRIDDMFGGEAGQGDQQGEAEIDKRAAARDEMQELAVELMNKLMGAGGSSSDAYINISEETASVRFLTRVKVAEFHPRDSKRLRLVDFGREIEDY